MIYSQPSELLDMAVLNLTRDLVKKIHKSIIESFHQALTIENLGRLEDVLLCSVRDEVGLISNRVVWAFSDASDDSEVARRLAMKGSCIL